MSQPSDSRLRLWRAEADWHGIHRAVLFLTKEVSIQVPLRYSEHSHGPVFRPEHHIFKAVSTNRSTSRRWNTESSGSVITRSAEPLRTMQLLRLEVIIALNLSNNPCEAWAWSSVIFHIKKLAVRKIIYLRFPNSSVTRWNLNSGPNWCSVHYLTLSSSERESFTLHEPKGQKEVEVTEPELVSTGGSTSLELGHYPTMDHHRRDLTRGWGSLVEEAVVRRMALDSEGPFSSHIILCLYPQNSFHLCRTSVFKILWEAYRPKE